MCYCPSSQGSESHFFARSDRIIARLRCVSAQIQQVTYHSLCERAHSPTRSSTETPYRHHKQFLEIDKPKAMDPYRPPRSHQGRQRSDPQIDQKLRKPSSTPAVRRASNHRCGGTRRRRPRVEPRLRGVAPLPGRRAAVQQRRARGPRRRGEHGADGSTFSGSAVAACDFPGKEVLRRGGVGRRAHGAPRARRGRRLARVAPRKTCAGLAAAGTILVAANHLYISRCRHGSRCPRQR